MSRVFVESFFPATVQILQSHPVTSDIHERFFPDQIRELCPEIVIREIRNPVLCLQAVTGAMLGLYGAYRTHKNERLWSIAFIFFGLMNVVAAPLHCFLPVHDDSTLPQQYPILWVLDNLFTGVSSTAIISACLREFKDRSSWTFALSSSLISEWLVCNSTLGGASVAAFLIFDWKLPLELWYLLPTVWAGAAVAPLLVMDAREGQISGNAWRSLVLCGVAAALVLCGLVLDAPFCRIFSHSSFALDTFTAPTLVFAACNLAFGGLLHRLQDPDSTKTKKKE
jgi:hypothetical protein